MENQREEALSLSELPPLVFQTVFDNLAPRDKLALLRTSKSARRAVLQWAPALKWGVGLGQGSKGLRRALKQRQLPLDLTLEMMDNAEGRHALLKLMAKLESGTDNPSCVRKLKIAKTYSARDDKGSGGADWAGPIGRAFPSLHALSVQARALDGRFFSGLSACPQLARLELRYDVALEGLELPRVRAALPALLPSITELVVWGCDAAHLVTALGPQLQSLRWYWSGACASSSAHAHAGTHGVPHGGTSSWGSSAGGAAAWAGGVSGLNGALAPAVTFPSVVAACAALRAVCVSQLDQAGLDALLALPCLTDVSVSRGLTLSASRAAAVPAAAARVGAPWGWRRLYVGGDVELQTLALLPLSQVEELHLQAATFSIRAHSNTAALSAELHSACAAVASAGQVLLGELLTLYIWWDGSTGGTGGQGHAPHAPAHAHGAGGAGGLLEGLGVPGAACVGASLQAALGALGPLVCEAQALDVEVQLCYGQGALVPLDDAFLRALGRSFCAVTAGLQVVAAGGEALIVDPSFWSHLCTCLPMLADLQLVGMAPLSTACTIALGVLCGSTPRELRLGISPVAGPGCAEAVAALLEGLAAFGQASHVLLELLPAPLGARALH